MPIDIQTVASDTYVLNWLDQVSLKEIQESHNNTAKLAKEAGISHYVHIIVQTQMKSFPFNPRGLLDVLFAYPNVIGVLVVDSSMIARSAVRILDNLTSHVTLENFKTLEEAKTRALTLLAERSRKTT